MAFTVAEWNLAAIMQEVRLITGRPDVTMMTDQTVVDMIQYYYQNVLPKELKIFWGYTYYQFYTQANIDQYTAPQNFQTLNPSAYVDGWPLEWYLSPDTFYQDYPQNENKQTVGMGTGTLNSFSFNISAYPVLARSCYVTDGTQVVQDNGLGSFVDSVTGGSVPGSIDYTTGVVTGLAFLVDPAANTSIICTSFTYLPNRPQGLLFYKTQPLTDSTKATLAAVNMFVLRPVPDQCYLVKLQGIQVPPPLINLTDVPFRPDLGPLIALGASLQIFKRFNQMDQYQQYLPEYARYKDISMQDTYEEYIYQRSVPAF